MLVFGIILGLAHIALVVVCPLVRFRPLSCWLSTTWEPGSAAAAQLVDRQALTNKMQKGEEKACVSLPICHYIVMTIKEYITRKSFQPKTFSDLVFNAHANVNGGVQAMLDLGNGLEVSVVSMKKRGRVGFMVMCVQVLTRLPFFKTTPCFRFPLSMMFWDGEPRTSLPSLWESFKASPRIYIPSSSKCTNTRKKKEPI